MPKTEEEALLQRIHPAESRFKMLARKTPASFVAFDLLVDESRGVQAAPQSERRSRLKRALSRAMLKIKHQRTADCVVGGFRWNRGQEGASVGSLLLGLYVPNEHQPLRHGTTFQRCRPDKPPRQCTFDQRTFAVPVELEEIFGLSRSRR